MEFKTTKQDGCYRIKITAEENGKVAGWAYLYVIFQDRHQEPYGMMENVYIEQEYRSRGLGGLLVKLLIEEARKQNCYKLIGTSKHNKPEVHAFYKKHGFKDIGLEFRMDLKESAVLTKD